ncbi:MAG TPA: BON domain-containing protein [Dehalococcoidia bacterium]|jgi:hypothetical protein|nr:BON domain-containing protein [Dehalococcoidia bacterium]
MVQGGTHRSLGREGYGGYLEPGKGQPWHPFTKEPRGGQPPPTGPYRGRGPRGYRRSDEALYEEICERMTRHPGLDATDFEVLVDDGDVTLIGTVEDRAQKRIAEEVAEQVSGVRNVANHLTVQSARHRTGTAEKAAGMPEGALVRTDR